MICGLESSYLNSKFKMSKNMNLRQTSVTYNVIEKCSKTKKLHLYDTKSVVFIFESKIIQTPENSKLKKKRSCDLLVSPNVFKNHK